MLFIRKTGDHICEQPTTKQCYEKTATTGNEKTLEELIPLSETGSRRVKLEQVKSVSQLPVIKHHKNSCLFDGFIVKIQGCFQVCLSLSGRRPRPSAGSW